MEIETTIKEEKAFLIDFEVTVDFAGTLQVEAKTEKEANLIAKRLIKECLNKEYCNIELSINESDKSEKLLTVKEIGNPRALNTLNSIALN